MKLLVNFLITVLFVGITFFGQAKSDVKVIFPGAEQQAVVVWTYLDLISLDKTVVASGQINSKGEFSFSTYNAEVQWFYIEVKYFRSSVLLEPKANYTIQYEPVNFQTRDFYPTNVLGFLNPPLRIIEPANASLNRDLDSLNLIFDNFVNQKHLALRLGQQSWKLVDSLEIDINHFLAMHPHTYLKQVAEIQLVQFRMLTNQYGDDYVVKTYFDPSKIQLTNPTYMSFFNSFWKNYIPSRLSRPLRFAMDSVVNKVKSYQALSALLAQDSLLRNPNLRELVVLTSIPSLYTGGKFRQDALIDILTDISSSKLNKSNQQIAIHLSKKLQKTKIGRKAPDFSLIDQHKDTLTLEKLKGKYVYIQLVSDECVECIAQMNYTKELYDKFNDIITFIHISVDRSEEDMLALIREQNYAWHFVYLNQVYHLVNDYQIATMPHAILIDKEGNFIAKEAPLPNQHFEEYFLQMLNEKKGNLNNDHQMKNGVLD
jgi:thiol-disulfide isomerase/thioredoxin